jgi:hypothetical protein
LSAAAIELPDGIGEGNSKGMTETKTNKKPLHKLVGFTTTAIVSSSTKQVGHPQSQLSVATQIDNC